MYHKSLIHLSNRDTLHFIQDSTLLLIIIKCIVVVIGATELSVETIDDVMSCLDTGSAARQTGTTNMNEESSRSHAIFTLYIGNPASHMPLLHCIY